MMLDFFSYETPRSLSTVSSSTGAMLIVTLRQRQPVIVDGNTDLSQVITYLLFVL